MAEQSDSSKGAAAQPAVVQATIHITRAATGKVETYQIVGKPVDPQVDEQKEAK